VTHNFESFVPEQIFTMTLLHGIVLISWIVAIAANSNTGIPSDYNNPITSMAQDEQSFMRHLAAGDTQGGYQTMFGGDAMNRYHDIYATAWRYIGFYIDCSNLYSNNNNNNHERDLGEDNQEERDLGENQGCNRYLLWAAYADLGYTGGGIGEYQYYNRFTDTWSDMSCDYTSSTYRCAKMDCHLPSENFKLLGYYKAAQNAQREWFGQLFKHEGVCVWNDEDTYEFMQGNKEKWPEKCASSGTYDNTTLLYYDLKPAADGNVTVGLYTDYYCSKDYTGDLDTESILDGLGYYQSTIDEWNTHFGAYKICQPCVAHSLAYMDGAPSGRRELKEDNNNNEIFQCYDQAGYTNCNQCMKFKTKTDFLTASLEDVHMAYAQKSLTWVPSMASLNIAASTYTTNSLSPAFGSSSNLWASVGLFFFSLFLLGAGVFVFYATFTNKIGSTSTFKEPLVPNKNLVAV